MSTKLWSRPFVMIMIINFLLFLSFNMINPSLPIYFQSLGIGETVTGICISVFTLGSIFIRPIAGGILDRFGRRSVFFISMAALVVIIWSYSLMTMVALILVLRILHGVDWGFSSTATSTLATDAIPRQMVGKGIGIFGLSMSVALAFAPALAVELMNRFEFRGMIYVSTSFLLIALALGLTYPFGPFQKAPADAPRKKSAIFEKTAILPAIIMGCITLTMGAVTTYVPLYAISLGMDNVGIFFTFYAIGLILVRLFIGSAVDRFGVTATTMPAFLFMLASLLLLAFADQLIMLLISGFLYGAGFGGAQTTMQSLSVMNAPKDRFGAANGTFFIGFDLGVGFGALLAGYLSETIGFPMMYLSLCLFILLAIVLVLRFHPHKITT